MSKDFLDEFYKYTPFFSLASLLVTINYYILGNPVGLPIKLQIVSASIISLPSGGSLDLPIFFAFITAITFILYLYVSKKI